MYCKLFSSSLTASNIAVLIVAKCIVNLKGIGQTISQAFVLIVAKCIVN